MKQSVHDLSTCGTFVCLRTAFPQEAETTLHFLRAIRFNFKVGPAKGWKGMIRDPFQPNPARLHADPDLPAGSPCQHTKPTAWKGRCIILCLGAGQHHPQVLPKRQAGLKVLWYCRKHAVPILEADRVYFTIHPTWKQLNRL